MWLCVLRRRARKAHTCLCELTLAGLCCLGRPYCTECKLSNARLRRWNHALPPAASREGRPSRLPPATVPLPSPLSLLRASAHTAGLCKASVSLARQSMMQHGNTLLLRRWMAMPLGLKVLKQYLHVTPSSCAQPPSSSSRPAMSPADGEEGGDAGGESAGGWRSFSAALSFF